MQSYRQSEYSTADRELALLKKELSVLFAPVPRQFKSWNDFKPFDDSCGVSKEESNILRTCRNCTMLDDECNLLYCEVRILHLWSFVLCLQLNRLPLQACGYYHHARCAAAEIERLLRTCSGFILSFICCTVV